MSEQHTAEIDAAACACGWERDKHGWYRVPNPDCSLLARAHGAISPRFPQTVSALAEHRMTVGGCACGWPFPDNRPMLPTHEAHVASVLTRVTPPAKSDRGAASLLAVCACLLVAISFAPDWWQRCFIAALFAFGIGCWVMARGAQRGAAIRDRLDEEAPKTRTYDSRDNAGTWFHEDGSICPTHWATQPTASNGVPWFCTEHQRYVRLADHFPTRHHTVADTLAAEDRVRAEDGHIGGRA